MRLVDTQLLVTASTHFVKILLIVALGYGTIRLIGVSIGRLEKRLLGRPGWEADDRVQRARTITRLLQSVAQFTVAVVVLMMVLSELKIDIGPVLAGLGVVGLALGFGTQTLVKDAVSGLFVLVEDQFGVGDVVKAGGVLGRVVKVTLRTTHVRDEEGALHVIPNGSLGVVTNYTREWSRAAVEVAVPAEIRVDTVADVLREAGEKLRSEDADVLAEPDVVAVLRKGQTSPIVRLSLRTAPGRQWQVATVLHRQVRAALKEKGLDAQVSVVSPSFSLDELSRLEDA
ncbi:MAG TPA: mechanosensitive ion channel family protein [Bacteroidetes bacterium]|nr:mechanosensitive ion channel family protein [Bacteroidota bacterium]